MMPQRAVRYFLEFVMPEKFDTTHAGGRAEVIHNGKSFIESLGRNDVLVGDPFVLVGGRGAIAMEPDVMLARNLTKLLIKWHVVDPPYRFPLASCSRSSASKRALKLPLPKLFAPLR